MRQKTIAFWRKSEDKGKGIYSTKSNIHIKFSSHENFNEIPHITRKKVLKSIEKNEKPRIASAILSLKSNPGGITIHDFK